MKKKPLLILCVLLFYCIAAKASVVIDSVKTSVSTCANNGSITVFAQTSTGTLLYAIVTGTVTAPVQTGNTFSSLPPGTYIVEVSNTANETQTTTVTITGNYQLPDFTPIITPSRCADSSSGTIIGNLTPGTGTAPYAWELVPPSPVVISQPGDTFSNLPSGSYTIRLTDGCNNVQTKPAILYTPPASMTYGYGYVKITGCDTAEVAVPMVTPLYRPPYKVTYTVGGVSYTVDTARIDDESLFYGTVWAYITIPNISYGSIINNMVVTNGCGVQGYVPQLQICPLEILNPVFVPISVSNCQVGVLTVYSIGNLTCNLNVYPKFPVTVTIRDIPANNVIETKVFHSVSDYITSTTAMLPGSSYNVTIEDSCNYSNTSVITTPVPTRYVSFGMNAQQTMLDSTVTASLFAVGFPTVGTTLTITSGPPSMHSTKPGYEYSENYIFPKTFNGQVSSDSSTAFFMANTGPGVYSYVITDSCGNQFPGTFEVTRNDVSSFHYSYTYQKGCVGSSGLQYEVLHNSFTEASLTDLSSGTMIHYTAPWQMNQNPFTNVVNNITASDYLLKFKYYGPYAPGGAAVAMNNILLDSFVVRDTIHVTPYENPAIKTTAVTSCSGQLLLALVADSTKGIPPYQYEIVNGPQTFPPQASNLFQLTQTGNYTIRLIDSCGNSVSVDVTVNPITFPLLSGLGNVCANDSVMLTYGASPYFTYTWTRPNGTTYAGDTLFINPVTTADTGTYTIRRITTINGCSNTETATYRLSLGKQDSAAVAICAGQTFTFGGRVLSLPGIYRDTIATASCDSISILKLVVNNFRTDSSAVSICRGQSFNFGGRALTQNGIYRDTIATSTCDSISILNLTVNELRKDSSVANICRGQSFSFGGRALTQSGIYRDTIATSTCDSISILNLTVNELRKDSSAASICRGQSFSFGGRALTQSGIYRDTIATSTCDSISIVNLTVNELRKDSSAVSICRGQIFNFGGRALTQSGIYRDTIATSTCDSISILNLTVNELRKDSSAASICRGQSFSFGGRALTQSGIYRDTIATSTCDSISVLNLTVSDFKKDSIAVSICKGQTYPFGNSTLSQAGIYRDTLATAGCDSISVVNLIVNDTPAIQIQSSKYFVTAGEAIQLTAVPNNLATYLWTSVNTISNHVIYNPASVVNTAAWYYVTVTDNNNCSNSDSLFIAFRTDSIFSCDGRTIIYIPNAFTPNGDIWNSQFRVLGINNVAYKLFHMIIYNRWGEVVFETDRSSQNWDGTYKGKPASTGNYVYFFRFICADGKTFTRKGNVLLLR